MAVLFFDVCPWSSYWATLSPRLHRLDATVEFLLALLWRHREVGAVLCLFPGFGQSLHLFSGLLTHLWRHVAQPLQALPEDRVVVGQRSLVARYLLQLENLLVHQGSNFNQFFRRG